MVILTVWYQWEKTHMDKWNRTASLDTNPVDFDKGEKGILTGKNTIFQPMVLEELDNHTQKNESLCIAYSV